MPAVKYIYRIVVTLQFTDPCNLSHVQQSWFPWHKTILVGNINLLFWGILISFDFFVSWLNLSAINQAPAYFRTHCASYLDFYFWYAVGFTKSYPNNQPTNRVLPSPEPPILRVCYLFFFFWILNKFEILR